MALSCRRRSPVRAGILGCVLSVFGLASSVAGQTQTTERISTTSGGLQPGALGEASISSDGRFVAFVSSASTFVAGDTNGVSDVFVKDRQTNQIERVSVATPVGDVAAQANGSSGGFNSAGPDISGNGRLVVFTSAANNLVAGDTNGFIDVFVHDRVTKVTRRISLSASGQQLNEGAFQRDFSTDGRFLTFDTTASNVVPGVSGGHVYRVNLETNAVDLVSRNSNGVPANDFSGGGVISADGRHVSFLSVATNLDLRVADTNGVYDVFVRDMQAGTTARVSVQTDGFQTFVSPPSSEAGGQPAISGNGRFVAFKAVRQLKLVADDNNGQEDVYVRDRDVDGNGIMDEAVAGFEHLTVKTFRVSVSASGTDANGGSLLPWVSSDGRFVAFNSTASNLVVPLPPGGSPSQIYVRDLDTDRDGVLDEAGGTSTSLASLSTTGAPANNSISNPVKISSNGRFVVFTSPASNLDSTLGDTNGATDVFVRDRGNPGPTIALDKISLRFGAVTNGSAFTSQTAAQVVRLTQAGTGTVTWSATSNQPWLQVSPASGTGSANLSVSVVSVGGLPLGGTVAGAITVTLTGASNTAGPIAVSLNLIQNGTSASPFGFVDTPVNNITGVTGAVPFTGWALDDIEVTRVSVCRAAVGAEVAPIDPNCGGARQIFVGFAVFIDGARPDVAATYSAFPVNTRGGWGFMVLTNTLPSQGNGTFVFHIWAHDRDGRAVVIGTRTMTCANASSILPFGAIDTPTQGGVASGTAYNVFGWVLSRTNRADPPGGGTVIVQVDGVTVGSPGGWTARPDLTGLFPGFPGISTALAVFGLNTTSLTNGLHTIQWVAIDNMGRIEGIGSRFFTVSNGAGAVTAAGEASAQTALRAANLEAIADAPLDSGAIVGRRGWDLAAPYHAFAAGGSGRVVVRSEEVNRVELQLGPAEHYSGHLRTSEGLKPLPIGSHLDTTTGVFTWAPGVGFVGAYDLVFVRWDGAVAVARHEVRIILEPKGSHLVGPQVVIDAPRSQQDVGQPFHLGGWAADLNAASGTGIATLHAWAYPLTGGPPMFLGATGYGGARPDVAAVHGEQFTESGFGLSVQGLTPGNYDLAVFAWSMERVDFVPARTVRVTVRP